MTYQGQGPAAGSGTPYRADIDGLRAIAVLLVVVFHFHLTGESKNGFVGVDIFFVISGFLITSIVRSEVEQQRFSIGQFWVRRLRRLAPALFVVLALVMVYGALRMLPTDLRQLAHEALATQLYVANIYFWQNVNYFGLQAGSIYLLHTWSLAVEEQFYIVYPLALWLVLRHGRRVAPLVVLAAALVSFGLNIAFVGSKPEATFYLMPTRAWELLIGALLTWLPAVRRAPVAHLLALVGAALVAAAVVGFDERVRFPGWFALLPTLGAACLIHAGSGCGSFGSRVLAAAPVVYVGRLSYSLYLVHWPINVFAGQELGEGYTLGWRAAMALASLLLAALLYHAVETPWRRGRHDARQRGFVLGYAGGVALSAALSAVVIVGQGLPQRLPAHVAQLAAFADDRAGIECEFPRRPVAERPAPCAIGVPGRPAQWLVYGDSHAWAARGAIDDWLQRTGAGGRFAFLNSCPPLQGLTVLRAEWGCRAINEHMLALSAEPQVRKVFLVSTWRQPKEGTLTDGSPRALDEAESIALFQRQFAATVAALRKLGKEVYVWEPVPGTRGYAPRQLALAALRGRPADIEFTLDQYRTENAFFFDALAANRGSIAGTFSPSAELCKSGRCAAMVGGKPVYYDNSHLAQSSRGFWADALSAQLSGLERRAGSLP